MVHHKHRGPRSKTRYKTKKNKRQRGSPSITVRLQEFKPGDRVHVSFNPSVHGGAPFRRFMGKTGLVTGKQGECYVITIRDKNAVKSIIVNPAHLQLQAPLTQTAASVK